MSDEKKQEKSDELKKSHESLRPRTEKVVTITLVPDDHLENTPSQQRKQPEHDDQ